ncbi:MAG: twin-arginine translocase subunit TatC [Gammaproteobacteria bacterium]|nr:twin-arginine translocase subunit TatC [Gammaproteobacteria bacterium]MCI0590495.1 twin-arginine translocase subunit TatC [Gammaproteobacteria bacterium]
MPPRNTRQDNARDREQSFLSHLTELRARILRSILCVFLVFLVLSPFANEIYLLIATPLIAQLPEGSTMIATEVAAPFLAPFKLTMMVAIAIGMPFVLYQAWAFIAPGLYQNERTLALPLVISSAVLFYLGFAFAYFVVFPLIFAFFTAVAPEGVTVMTDISSYLNFVLTLFFAFGIAFEVPVATFLMAWTGMTTHEALVAKRRHVIVAAFVIGMVLTPPDVVSQILLAVPIWLLFELGVFFSRTIKQVRDAQVPSTPRAQGNTSTSSKSVPTSVPIEEGLRRIKRTKKRGKRSLDTRDRNS